ncbi:unnamed protein product [Allacma fusca]|uniref:Uncharacterized protein n=1 Tax=Allacma fusca TaxID=39272 RepID=A0A8J2L803_9HEXA|nr:unnamed protein product [Allacma fusca]
MQLLSRSSTRKKRKDVPRADNLMTLQEKKLLQLQFDYQNICNLCEYEGKTASEIARHESYKCQLPLTNQMLYDLLPEKPKGTFRKTKSRELDASGVSNKALQRMFDQDDTLDFVGTPVCFYPTRQWRHLLGMTHSAMIVVKIRDLVNGTVQVTFYDSFQPTRSKMFTDRVRQSDVCNIVSRLIGTSVAITEDIVWPSP